jgi:RHH-type transcriptional regulator, rel operon repressor / antitoxin RelB
MKYVNAMCGGRCVEKVSITVRLDEETVAFLDKLGEVEDRDRSYLVRKAVSNFVELHRWQIEQIEQAVKEADAGLFLSDEETEAFMQELGR